MALQSTSGLQENYNLRIWSMRSCQVPAILGHVASTAFYVTGWSSTDNNTKQETLCALQDTPLENVVHKHKQCQRKLDAIVQVSYINYTQ